MRILLPYAYSELGPFAQPDVAILRAHHAVEIAYCDTVWRMLVTMGRVARSDLLFCWFGSTRYLPAVLVARLLRRPVIIVAGGYDVANEPAIGYGNMRPGLARFLGRLLFRQATWVVPFSFAAAREAQREAGVPEARTRVIRLGFDGSRVAGAVESTRKEPIVVSIAHMNSSSIVRKGILTLLEASARMPETRFVLAGAADADAERMMRSLAGPNVEFPGFLSNEERDALLARAKVYCQPSTHEGFGAAVAEAMLFDCLPVVSRRGSLPEVAGPCGRFVEPGDVDGLVAALRDALQSTDASRRPREYIRETFPLTARASALLGLVDEVARPRWDLNARGGPSHTAP